VVADLPPAGDGPWRWGRALAARHWDTLLLEQAKLSGVQVMQPWALQAFKVAQATGNVRCATQTHSQRGICTARWRLMRTVLGRPMPFERDHRPGSAADLLAFKANSLVAALKTGLLLCCHLRAATAVWSLQTRVY